MKCYSIKLRDIKTGEVRENLSVYVDEEGLLPGVTYNGTLGVRPEVSEIKNKHDIKIKSKEVVGDEVWVEYEIKKKD